MTIDPGFFDLMPTLVVVERYLSEDSFGNDTFLPGIEVYARVEPLSATVSVTTQQNNTMSAAIGIGAQLIMDLTDPTFSAKDRVTFDNRTLRVQEVVIEYDENGPYYQSLQVRNNQPQ